MIDHDAGSSGALAATNSRVAVLVANIGQGSQPLTPLDVMAVLQGGSSATVSDVQAIPDQHTTYLIEVCLTFMLI
jgi:hypothetical protein